jgi:hypothetical protein
MKAEVRRFKSMNVALHELERYIRHGDHLETGRGFKQFGDLRSREMLGNWLLCAAMNEQRGSAELSFTTDPDKGDGVIHDSRAGFGWPTEHVMVSRRDKGAGNIETKILSAIEKKRKKGKAYATGKTLVVFSNFAGGEWHPNKVARRLPDPLHFNDVWVVCLQRVAEGRYIYGVTQLVQGADCPTWTIIIAEDFGSWKVEKIQ